MVVLNTMKAFNNLLDGTVGTTLSRSNFMDAAGGDIIVLVVLLVWLGVSLLLGKWLYNNVLCKTVSGIKPLPNVWHYLGLAVLLHLML